MYIVIIMSLGSKREYKSFWPEWSQAFSEFTLLLISLCVQFLYVSVAAKYLNFTTFSKRSLAIFILRFSLYSMNKKWTYTWFYMHFPMEYRIYDAHSAFFFVICTYVCMYACVCTYVYMYFLIYIYIYIYIYSACSITLSNTTCTGGFLHSLMYI